MLMPFSGQSMQTRSALSMSTPVTPGGTPGGKAKARPLLAVDLPAEKKQRRAVSEEDDDADAEMESRPEYIAAAHNTPSPGFFAGVTTSHVYDRLTINPSNPQPPFLTRVRHAKQLVIVTSNPRHNKRPYKAGKDMDVVRRTQATEHHRHRAMDRIVHSWLLFVFCRCFSTARLK